MVQEKLVSSEKTKNDNNVYHDEPALRFPEFNDSWKRIKIHEITDSITKGTTPKNYSEEGINFIKVENIENNQIININSYIDVNTHKNELSRSILEKNDLLFSIAETLGRTAKVTEDILPANTNQALAILKINDLNAINVDYVQTRLNCSDIEKYIFQNLAVGAQPNLNLKQVGDIEIKLPSKSEQDKIQNFINSINKKIELLEKKYNEKLIFKEEFFNKYISSLSKETQKIKLNNLIKILNDRNKNNDDLEVLSISNKLGFISQEKQFEDRIVASSDTKNYKIVKKGYFAYNPARINVGSIARLKNYDEGIISPMYIVFKINEDLINPIFFENYLSTNYFKLEILKRLEGSVRLILSAESLKNIEIFIPPLDEQDKISSFMITLTKSLELSKIELDNFKEFKKGLLQKMFV